MFHRVSEFHKMKTKIERIFKAAYAYGASINCAKTIPDPLSLPKRPPPKAYTESQRELLEALDCSTAEDFNLKQSIHLMRSRSAPVAYMELHENKWFSLGIFVIFKGGQIPLHDHPGMEGALKVIAGNVKINSFTVLGRHGPYFTTREDPSTIINCSHRPELLEPEEKNIHQLEYADSSEGTSDRPYAAFIDFLSPPYGARPRTEGDEFCHYYERVRLLENNASPSTVVLGKCNSPPTYWTEELRYQGPPFHETIQKLQRMYPDSC